MPRKNYFNPLPPRGGRLRSPCTPTGKRDFNPLPPRGGRHFFLASNLRSCFISTHSLLAEGDQVQPPVQVQAAISTHSLLAEGDNIFS